MQFNTKKLFFFKNIARLYLSVTETLLCIKISYKSCKESHHQFTSREKRYISTEEKEKSKIRYAKFLGQQNQHKFLKTSYYEI